MATTAVAGNSFNDLDVRCPCPLRAWPDFESIMQRISPDSEQPYVPFRSPSPSLIPSTPVKALSERLIQQIHSTPASGGLPTELQGCGINEQVLARMSAPIRDLILSRPKDVEQFINTTPADLDLLHSLSVEVLSQFLNQTNEVALLVNNNLISLDALCSLPYEKRARLLEHTPDLEGLMAVFGFSFESFARFGEREKIMMLQMICG